MESEAEGAASEDGWKAETVDAAKMAVAKPKRNFIVG